MIVTAQAKNYDGSQVINRYVRYDRFRDLFIWCEVGLNRKYDLRQGTVSAGELPVEIALAAKAKSDRVPSYINWPFA